MGSIVPVLETTPPRNSNPQPVSGFNQPRGIAGVFSYAANPTQPGQMQTNTSETITANNNQIIAELNRETTQAKTAVNIDTAKHLVEKQDNRKRQTNSSAADSSAFHVVRRYSYGLQGPISMSQLINGQWVTSFFIYDGQGNVRALTDENGNVTDTYAYDAHGNLIDQTGNTPNTRLYHGEEYDADLGMYYLRARFLNTATGRFFNMDSSEGKNLIPLSLHKYLYANANPVNKIDPTGLSSIDFISATGLASVLSTVGTLNPHMIRAVYSNSITLHDNAQVLTGTGWTIGDATAVFQKASDFWRPYGINVQGSVSEFTCPTTSIDCQRLRGLLGGVGTYDSRSGASPTAENVSADYDWETHIIPLIPTLSKHNTIFIGFIAHPTIPGTAIVGRTNLSRSGQYTGVAVSLLASPDATKKELGSDTVLSIDLLGRFLAHEWGHTFGLPDSSLPNNLMNGGSFGPQLDPKTQVEEALKFTFEKY
jgi:RHS repeat-associated protein